MSRFAGHAISIFWATAIRRRTLFWTSSGRCWDSNSRTGLCLMPVQLELAVFVRRTSTGGLRMRATADIAGARITVNVDVGFGDATEPPAEWLDYPVLLDMPAPRLRGYARETVLAEKFQAMVDLGMANSRMKDYYDLWIISQAFEIDRSRLAAAISATFARRGTPIPDQVPDGLSPTFVKDAVKRQQWESFKQDLSVDPGPLDGVVSALEAILMPAAAVAHEVGARDGDRGNGQADFGS